MTSLSQREIALITGVFRRHPEVSEVRLFGSRAKDTHASRSDVDLALWGVDALRAEAVAAELDDLPLPYHFDVVPFDHIKQASLREYIERVGITLEDPDQRPSNKGTKQSTSSTVPRIPMTNPKIARPIPCLG